MFGAVASHTLRRLPKVYSCELLTILFSMWLDLQLLVICDVLIGLLYRFYQRC